MLNIKLTIATAFLAINLSACDKLPLGKTSEQKAAEALQARIESSFSIEVMNNHVFGMFSHDKAKLTNALKQMGNEYAVILADDLIVSNQTFSKPVSVSLTPYQLIHDTSQEVMKRRSQFTLTREDGNTKIGIVTAEWKGGEWTYRLGE